jgi:hypothetical protein
MGSVAEGDVVGHFRQAYGTVVRFPVLVVPPILVGILGFALLFLIAGGATVVGALMGGLLGGSMGGDGGAGAAAGGIAGLILGALLFAAVMGTLWFLSSSMVVVMASEALAGREPRLGDAFWAVVRRLGALMIASLLVTVIVGIAFLFLVIPGLVAMVCLMFTLPAVLLDGLGAVDAMRRSFAVVRAHVGPVVGLVVGCLLVFIGVAIVTWIVGWVPVLGHLGSFVIHSAVVSYLTVVGVRVYQTLRTPADGVAR